MQNFYENVFIPASAMWGGFVAIWNNFSAAFVMQICDAARTLLPMGIPLNSLVKAHFNLVNRFFGESWRGYGESLWIRFPFGGINYFQLPILLWKQSAALSATLQQSLSLKLGSGWGMEILYYIRFSLLKPLYAVCGVNVNHTRLLAVLFLLYKCIFNNLILFVMMFYFNSLVTWLTSLFSVRFSTTVFFK